MYIVCMVHDLKLTGKGHSNYHGIFYEDKARITVCTVSWLQSIGTHMYMNVPVWNTHSAATEIKANTFLQAIHQNLTSDNHVWIFPAWYTSDWYNTTKYPNEKVNCTVDTNTVTLSWLHAHNIISLHAISRYRENVNYTVRCLRRWGMYSI